MEAIVLAAGRGTRLAGAHPGPKALVPIGDTTIIDRMMTLLVRHGMDPIVVGGHRADDLEEIVDRHPEARLVRNRRFAETGTLHSLAVGLAARADDTEPVMVLNGDIVFEETAVTAVAGDARGRSATVVTRLDGRGDEAYAGIADGVITGISKNRHDIGGVVRELVGISVLTDDILATMYATAREWPGGSSTANYEVAMGAIAPTKPILATRVDELLWGEVDTVEQMARLQRDIYPGILRREQRS